jgi:small-conductance mechanosensitive channel
MPLYKKMQRKEICLKLSFSVIVSIFAVSLMIFFGDPELKRTFSHILLYNYIPIIVFVVTVVIISIASNYTEQRFREKKIEIVEERFREHPDKPQFAWDLARAKLENYLDRNLSQVRSIYWLTLLVMLCGFGFVLFGLSQAAQYPDKLPVSIVASASGVLISFIGGSFLLIYRSILAQSKEYVTVLERINAVGMAVQVIASIPDSNGELKHSTTADLAKQLLNLYASPVTRSADKPSKSQLQSAA